MDYYIEHLTPVPVSAVWNGNGWTTFHVDIECSVFYTHDLMPYSACPAGATPVRRHNTLEEAHEFIDLLSAAEQFLSCTDSYVPGRATQPIFSVLTCIPGHTDQKLTKEQSSSLLGLLQDYLA